MGSNKTLLQRFEEKIFYSPDGCWYWTGALSTDGYGRINVDYKNTNAHIISYQLFKGEIGDGEILHSCDNRSCVNPDHLSIGTHQQNMRDMCNRGRSLRGSQNQRARFNDMEVKVILEAAIAGHKQLKIAKYFKCNHSMINRIVNRVTYTSKEYSNG